MSGVDVFLRSLPPMHEMLARYLARRTGRTPEDMTGRIMAAGLEFYAELSFKSTGSIEKAEAQVSRYTIRYLNQELGAGRYPIHDEPTQEPVRRGRIVPFPAHP